MAFLFSITSVAAMSAWCDLSILLILLARVDGDASTNFNASLRDHSRTEDINQNNSMVRTLQASGRVVHQKVGTPWRPMRFKEVPDNIISSSSHSHSRGLLHHEPGYEVQDYDEGPHGYYGPYTPHHEPHFNHFGHEHDYHLDYHHHKHYDPGLTAKAILLPVAGLAILGAAAALVTNPVLLQLGVVSGRRRRDATPDYTSKIIEHLQTTDYTNQKQHDPVTAPNKAGTPLNSGTRIRRYPAQPLMREDHNGRDDITLVPIPLKIRDKRTDMIL